MPTLEHIGRKRWGRLETLAVIVCAAIALTACTGEPVDGTGGDPLGPSARERMAGRQSFALAATAPEGGSFVSGQLSGALAGEPQLVALPVVGGRVTTRTDADGLVQLEQLEIELADVVLSEAQFPPHGLWLSGMRLRAARPAEAPVTWSDDDQHAVASVEVDLVLDWGVVVDDGELHPLASQTARGVRFELEVAASGPGGLSLSAGAFADGVVWRWSSLVELADVGVELVGVD